MPKAHTCMQYPDSRVFRACCKQIFVCEVAQLRLNAGRVLILCKNIQPLFNIKIRFPLTMWIAGAKLETNKYNSFPFQHTNWTEFGSKNSRLVSAQISNWMQVRF